MENCHMPEINKEIYVGVENTKRVNGCRHFDESNRQIWKDVQIVDLQCLGYIRNQWMKDYMNK